MTSWEALAMFLSLLYIILAIKQSLWCWPAAFFSTLIYAILFFDASLLMDSFLNAYYLVMAVYGWYAWKYTNAIKKNEELSISSYGLNKNIKIILILSIISVLLGYVMDNYTKADFAYTDSATTVFALFATYMLAQKIVENWLYWIVIDSASIYIYIQKGFYLTSILFGLYTILALLAYQTWKRELTLDVSRNS